MGNWIEWQNGKDIDLIKSIDAASGVVRESGIDFQVTRPEPDLFKSLVMADAYNRASTDILEKAILTDKQRENTDKMHYLLPNKHMFPTPDIKHARLAYDMAKRALDAGHITEEEYNHVRKAAMARCKALGDEMGEE